MSCVLIVSHDKICTSRLQSRMHSSYINIAIIAKLIGIPFITGDFYVIYTLINISTHAKLVKRGLIGCIDQNYLR